MTPIQAAAERLRRMNYGANYRDVYGELSLGVSYIQRLDQDRATLADWALGLLDEGEVTEAALKAIGFATQPEQPDFVLFLNGIETRRIYTDEREDRYWSYQVGRNEVPLIGGLQPKTRGQLRSLLHALQAGGEG